MVLQPTTSIISLKVASCLWAKFWTVAQSRETKVLMWEYVICFERVRVLEKMNYWVSFGTLNLCPLCHMVRSRTLDADPFGWRSKCDIGSNLCARRWWAQAEGPLTERATQPERTTRAWVREHIMLGPRVACWLSNQRSPWGLAWNSVQRIRKGLDQQV